jgi:hypothetical protein
MTFQELPCIMDLINILIKVAHVLHDPVALPPEKHHSMKAYGEWSCGSTRSYPPY